MITKIKKTRGEVLTRIKSIQSSPNFVPEEQPPKYEQISTSSNNAVGPVTYKDLATALNELSFDPNQDIEEDVVYSHDDVQVYFISPTGEVTSTQEPQNLKISIVHSM